MYWCINDIICLPALDQSCLTALKSILSYCLLSVFSLFFMTLGLKTQCRSDMPYTAIFHSVQGIVSSVSGRTCTICRTCGGLLHVMVSESWLRLVAHVWLFPEVLKRGQQEPHNTGLNNNQHVKALKSQTWLIHAGNHAWNEMHKFHTSFCNMKLKKGTCSSAWTVIYSMNSRKYFFLYYIMCRRYVKHI